MSRSRAFYDALNCALVLLLTVMLCQMVFGQQANTTPNSLLISEGRRWGVQSLATGQQHPVLQQMAQRHADYQASAGVQGHQFWDQRMQELERAVPSCRHFVEVAAESWGGEGALGAAAEMFNSWRQSPGHWAAVNGPSSLWGYAMSYCRRNQTWYAAGVFGYSSYRVGPDGFRIPVAGRSAVRQPQSISSGRSARTANFIISASTGAQQIAQAAEKARKEMAIIWIGKELPNWPRPCSLTAHVSDRFGMGGFTGFEFANGEVVSFNMRIQGSLQGLLDSIIPHEVTHTIFATHFRQPVPRWADEGACTTVEHISERNKHNRMLVKFLQTNRGIPFDRMMAMREYPRDFMPLYAQGYSVSRFLIEKKGRRTFILFFRLLFGRKYR